MAFNTTINDRLREALQAVPLLEERHMFGGVCYMVDGKMCIGVVKDEVMCRVGPEQYEACLEKPGCREMVFSGRPLRGFVYVSDAAMRSKQELQYWIDLCLAFNPIAKQSNKRKSKTKDSAIKVNR
ncbi:TfoX/Sxy family protein [Dyadobacter tibetensis]|uniref:TfoX/Sxy family protein n=1 Tax=Dyadobacter tibetensis TaxID=1211851 RepID=UPI000471CBAD|nr:TfoX/Sxy family protein [Dyadobacter tibetensis]